jgi:hypothetical protein
LLIIKALILYQCTDIVGADGIACRKREACREQ